MVLQVSISRYCKYKEVSVGCSCLDIAFLGEVDRDWADSRSDYGGY